MHNLNIALNEHSEYGSGYTDSTSSLSPYSISVCDSYCTVYRFESKEAVLRFIDSIRESLNKINKELKK